MADKKCSACGEKYPAFMFEPSGEMYPHLHLTRVCKRCQTNPRTCTNCSGKYPAVRKYFYSKIRGKKNLSSWCISCTNSINSDNIRKRKHGLETVIPAGIEHTE